MTRPDPTHPGQLVIGLGLWAVWFVVVYAGVSVACERVPPAPAHGPWNPMQLGLLALTLIVTTVLLAAAWRCHRSAHRHVEGSSERFVANAAAALYLWAALGALMLALPLAAVPPCV